MYAQNLSVHFHFTLHNILKANSIFIMSANLQDNESFVSAVESMRRDARQRPSPENYRTRQLGFLCELIVSLHHTAGSRRSLDLTECDIRSDFLVVLAPKLGTALEELVLDGNKLGDDDDWVQPLAEALRKMPNLRKLSMRDCHLMHRRVADVFAALVNKPNFTTLDISLNFPQEEGHSGPEGHPALIALGPLLQHMPALEALKIECVDLGTLGAAAIFEGLEAMGAGALGRFKDFGLSLMNLVNPDIERFVGVLMIMPGLRKLYISDMPAGHQLQWLKLLVAIGTMQFLEELTVNMSDCLREGGVFEWEALAQSLINKEQLQYLNLGGNGMGCIGARALARCLPKLTALRQLALDSNALGNSDLLALVPAIEGLVGGVSGEGLDGRDGVLEQEGVDHNATELTCVEGLSERVKRAITFRL